MVATPNIRTTQGEALASVGGPVTNLRLTQFDALVALNFPSLSLRTTQAEGIVSAYNSAPTRISQAQALVAAKGVREVRTSQAQVLVAARGRVANPRVRSWTFSLDGHDYYVLRLGTDVTLIYDDSTEQWVEWSAYSVSYWPVNIGSNWVGAIGLHFPDGSSYGSNIVVGDDSIGLLYILDPEMPYDESIEADDPQQQYYFPRTTMGQMPITGRQVMPCYAAWLSTDMGSPAYVGASVKLEISDDAGVTYYDAGSLVVTAGTNRPELSWYSLGQIEAPGRLFRISDDGAIARIDGMEMNDPDDVK